jgi:competence protein ComEC
VRLRGDRRPAAAAGRAGSYDFARDAYFERIGGPASPWADPQLVDAWIRRRLGCAGVMAVNAFRWRLARRIVAHGARQRRHRRGHGHRPRGLDHARSRPTPCAPRAWRTSCRSAACTWPSSAASSSPPSAWASPPGRGWRCGRRQEARGRWRVSPPSAGYLVLSGAPPPAERAAITASVAFAGHPVRPPGHQPARLALAALLILALQPEAAATPGFQMSFAATAALVALAEAWPRPVREISVPWPIRAARAFGAWLAVSILASLVAGLATGPFAMQHFNRVAVWGLPANLIVAPLSSFVIMPALAVGAVLEAVRLGGPFLTVAGWGIAAMVAVAQLRFERRSPRSGRDRQRPAGHPGPRLPRRDGPVPVERPPALDRRSHGAGGGLWPRPTAPDLWIAADGSAAAVREGHTAIVMRPVVRRFGVELWARRRGLTPVSGEGFICDHRSCRPGPGAPAPVSLSWTRKSPEGEPLAGLCRDAEVVILRGPTPPVLPAECRALTLLTAEDFHTGGAAELYRHRDGWWVVWAQPLRGRRPWSTLR